MRARGDPACWTWPFLAPICPFNGLDGALENRVRIGDIAVPQSGYGDDIRVVWWSTVQVDTEPRVLSPPTDYRGSVLSQESTRPSYTDGIPTGVSPLCPQVPGCAFHPVLSVVVSSCALWCVSTRHCIVFETCITFTLRHICAQTTAMTRANSDERKPAPDE